MAVCGDVFGSKQLRSLAKQRNFAAHNAPMAHVFESIDTGQLEIRFEIRGVNNREHLVTQAALQKWFKDAVALENDLALLAGRISEATSAWRDLCSEVSQAMRASASA